MEIILKRIAKQNTYTIGRMYILNDTQGCILPGENWLKGMVVNSRIWLHRLMGDITAARDREESVWITVM